MKPKRISSGLVGAKLALLMLGLFILVPALIGVFSKSHAGSIGANVLSGFVLTAVSIWLLAKQRKVMFDDYYLYITTGKHTKQIPLENIHKIKLTMTNIGTARFAWKIGYTDNNSEEKTIRILPGAGNNYFEEFKHKVREKNPSVMIKNWSHSFDFDQ